MKHTILLAALSIFLGDLLIAIPFGSATVLAATRTQQACGASSMQTARCLAIVVTSGEGAQPLVASKPQGYGPLDFSAAYGNHGTAHTTVGIVVAYDAPTIQADLTTFSKTYGLPALPICKSAAQTGCLDKVSQHGVTTYPRADTGWAVETSLDTEAVHGQCPGCRIELVEATTPSMSNLVAAVDEAATLGARVVSNSYGSAESSNEVSYDSHYHRSGVTMVASSGDSGYGTSYPATSPYVVAIGGTTLKMDGPRVRSEIAWSGAGSGCSQFEPKPSWQRDKQCSMRSVADIAADADPNTGAAVYDSYTSSGHSGWITVGGTSLAAPLVAGIMAANSDVSWSTAAVYSNAARVARDIVAGSNGNCSTYLCKAGTGYDGPTGLGALSNP